MRRNEIQCDVFSFSSSFLHIYIYFVLPPPPFFFKDLDIAKYQAKLREKYQLERKGNLAIMMDCQKLKNKSAAAKLTKLIKHMKEKGFTFHNMETYADRVEKKE